MIELLNCDCMDLAIETTKYVSLPNANIEGIADWESRRIYSLCGFNIERVCSIYQRAGALLRCAFGYREQIIKSPGKNYDRAANRSAAVERIEGVYFQYKEKWQRWFKEISGRGNRFIRSGLFGYTPSWVFNFFGNAGYNQHSGRQFARHSLRREGHRRLQKCYFLVEDSFSKRNFNENRTSYFCGQQNASGGVLAL